MGKKNILIIEDDLAIGNLLQEVLTGQGFEILLAKNGIEARKTLKDITPDMVITDLLLPGEHGINLIKEIKDKYFIPLVIISGIYQKEELESLMDNYFVEGFFQKPIEMDKLVAKVKAILDE